MATAWAITPKELGEVWADAPFNESVRQQLLAAALWQIRREARESDFELPDPEYRDALRRAHLMQTRNLWNAQRADDQGELGAEGFTIPIRPVDWQVKALLHRKTPNAR